MAGKDMLHRTLNRATEPPVLFPLIAVLLLAVIWGTTLGVIRVQHAAAQHAAAVSSRELLETYEAQVALSKSHWDGMRRWTRARELYGFPLAVLVGLSVDEQMAAAHAQTRAYLAWTALGSLIVVLLTGLLGRMSWQLALETKDQAEFLRTHACDELQGFYFKRPLPAEEFTQLLRAQATEITYIGQRLRLKAV